MANLLPGLQEQVEQAGERRDPDEQSSQVALAQEIEDLNSSSHHHHHSQEDGMEQQHPDSDVVGSSTGMLDQILM